MPSHSWWTFLPLTSYLICLSLSDCSWSLLTPGSNHSSGASCPVWVPLISPCPRLLVLFCPLYSCCCLSLPPPLLVVSVACLCCEEVEEKCSFLLFWTVPGCVHFAPPQCPLWLAGLACALREVLFLYPVPSR